MRLSLLILLLLRGPAGAASPVESPPADSYASGKAGAVASPHPLATEAGIRVLKDGGNAFDAAVAVGLTLGVVDGHNSGIGGGCFLLARLPSGEIIALDGRKFTPPDSSFFHSDGAPLRSPLTAMRRVFMLE